MNKKESLKAKIEQKVNWGKADLWTKYDFERLSEMIFEQTRTRLSVSTLMRFFGKVNYNSVPSVTTLNVLSQFVGFDDWRSFPSSKFKLGKIKIPVLLGVVLGTLLVVLYYVISFPKNSDFSFFSKKVLTEGVPNTVVFEYEASRANGEVFISQDWDTSRKIKVDKNDKYHSSIYYHPGYFNAKLLVNNKVVKEHGLLIKTQGWLGLLERPFGVHPIYLRQSDYIKGDSLEITPKTIGDYSKSEWISIYNYAEFTKVSTDNFSVEGFVKSTSDLTINPCNKVQIIVQSKDEVLIIPFVQKGCEGELEVYSYGTTLASKNNDLSGLGTDMKHWQKFTLRADKAYVRILLNDRIVLFVPNSTKPSDIVGVQVKSQGELHIKSWDLNGISL